MEVPSCEIVDYNSKIKNYTGKLTQGTSGSIAYDVYSEYNYNIQLGERKIISTGLFINFKEGYGGLLKSRSSMAVAGIDVCGGVIDTDYKGEIKVILHNYGTSICHIKKDDRVAQLIIIKNYAGKLTDKIRGDGGFGSTGK